MRRAALANRVDDFEIIVVDDGSADGSLEVLEALQSTVAELRIVQPRVEPRVRRGAHLGVRRIDESNGSSTPTATPNTTPPNSCAASMRRPLTTDVVQGWKIGRGDPWYRKLIGRTYHHVVKLLFHLHVRDTDCDFRLIRRSLLDRVELTSTSGVICVEMMRKFEQAGARFVEVGVSHHATALRPVAVLPAAGDRAISAPARRALVASGRPPRRLIGFS